jgi:hypothetical protein
MRDFAASGKTAQPVRYALRFIASVSVALWLMIIAAASWLIG